MKNIFKRAVAMLLLMVMVLGILPSDLSMAFAATTATPTEATQNLLADSTYNADFQTAKGDDPTKPLGWTAVYQRDWAVYELTPRATGNTALKITVMQNSGASGTLGINGFYSEAINVESLVGKTLMVNADARIASGTPGLNINVYFYTDTGKPTSIAGSSGLSSGSFNMASLISDEWTTVSTSQLAINSTASSLSGQLLCLPEQSTPVFSCIPTAETLAKFALTIWC